MNDFFEKIEKENELLTENRTVFDLFKHSPLKYFKIKKILKEVIKKFKKIDNKFTLPKIKIRYTHILGLNASIKYINKLFLNINPKIVDNLHLLRESIAHEFMHFRIGSDFGLVGYKIFPEHCPNSKISKKCYKQCNFSLRIRLYCFLYKNRFSNMYSLNGYFDMLFKRGINGFIHFEEVLVTYASYKLLNYDIMKNPDLKKIFDDNYYDKKLLTFMDKDLPNIRIAIENLIQKYKP